MGGDKCTLVTEMLKARVEQALEFIVVWMVPHIFMAGKHNDLTKSLIVGSVGVKLVDESLVTLLVASCAVVLVEPAALQCLSVL